MKKIPALTVIALLVFIFGVFRLTAAPTKPTDLPSAPATPTRREPRSTGQRATGKNKRANHSAPHTDTIPRLCNTGAAARKSRNGCSSRTVGNRCPFATK